VPGVYGKVTAPAAVTYMLENPGRSGKPDKRDRTGGWADARAKVGRQPGKPAGKPDARRGDERKRTAPDDPADEPELDAGGGRWCRAMIEDKPAGRLGQRPPSTTRSRSAASKYWKIDKKDNEYVSAAIQPASPSLSAARGWRRTGWSVPLAFRVARYGGQQAWTTNTAVGGGRQPPARAATPLALRDTATERPARPTAYGSGAASSGSPRRCPVFSRPAARMPRSPASDWTRCRRR